MRRLVWAALILGISPFARAEDADVAERHYGRAETLILLGDCAGAVEELKQAFHALERPEFLWNIARCHEQLGEAVEEGRAAIAHKRQAVWTYRSYCVMPGARRAGEAETAITKLGREIEELVAREREREVVPRRWMARLRALELRAGRMEGENAALRLELSDERAKRREAEAEREREKGSAATEKRGLEGRVETLSAENEKLRRSGEANERRADEAERAGARDQAVRRRNGRTRRVLAVVGGALLAAGGGTAGISGWRYREADDIGTRANRLKPNDPMREDLINDAASVRAQASGLMGGAGVFGVIGLAVLVVAAAWPE